MKTIQQSTIKNTLGLAALGLALLVAGCHAAEAEPPPAEPEGVPVRTAPVLQETEALPIRSSGRLAAKAEARLSFKISGIIDRILVDEGDRVRKGQTLARLNLTEIDAQVSQAQSAFEKAERDHARMARLYQDSVVTLKQFQDAQTGLETAQAGLDAAGFNRRFAVITAPQRGRILRRLAEDNEWASPGQPIFVLSAAGEGWVVRVGLADRDVVKLRLGDAAEVSFDAYPGRVFAGRVTQIADAADPVSGTFEVEVQVPDPEGLLKSGFVAKVEVTPSTGEGYHLVPIEALVGGDENEGIVYALEPETGRARRTPVTIARITDRHLAIATGLNHVAQVVTDGAAYLKDGDNVTVVE